MGKKKAESTLPAGMTKRSDGTIMFRFTVEGVRYAVYGATKKECREKEQIKREQIKAGTYKKSKDLTVSEYLVKWLDSRTKPTSATIRTYTKLINRMTRQEIDAAGHKFGDIKLKDLEAEHVRQLQKSLKSDRVYKKSQSCEKTMSTRTVNDSISLLKHALETAAGERIIQWNPAKTIEPLPRTEEPARNTIHRALTRDEVDAFLQAAADSWYYRLYVFLLNTGMRIGEASALTPEDVTGGKINIHKTVTRTEAGYTIAEQTKTDAGRRIIPTKPEAWKVVHEQEQINLLINAGKGKPENKPIFTQPKGGIIRPDRVNDDIKRFCKIAGIETFTCHAFRATSVSRCVAAGMEPLLIMEIHGHKDPAMLALYAHGEEEKRREQFLAVNM